VKLADLHARFLATAPARSVRRASHDVVQRERRAAAVSERDLMRRGLAQVLGATAVPELAPAQDASTDAALASGITHLADLIERTLTHGTPDFATLVNRTARALANGAAIRHRSALRRAPRRSSDVSGNRAFVERGAPPIRCFAKIDRGDSNFFARASMTSPRAMQTPVDHFVKQLLDLALSWTGTPVADAVVPSSDDQRADVVYVPDPALRARLNDFGLFGRIAAEPRHIEHFTDPPDYEAFVECVRKRLNLQHDEALRAAREERPVRTYTLWVLCAGDPVTLRATLRLRRAKGWPHGVWALPGLAVNLVVISALPRTPETVFLRLMGSDPVREQAVKELEAPGCRLPRLEDLLKLVIQLRVHRRRDAKGATTPKEEPEMIDLSIYNEWEQETLEKGRLDGIEKGIEKALAPLERQFSRRLGRSLTPQEHATLVRRLDTHGADRLGDVVLDLSATQLAVWLEDPAAT
jgi:hypothetical protein